MLWVIRYFKEFGTLQGANIKGLLTKYFLIGSWFIVNELHASCNI